VKIWLMFMAVTHQNTSISEDPEMMNATGLTEEKRGTEDLEQSVETITSGDLETGDLIDTSGTARPPDLSNGTPGSNDTNRDAQSGVELTKQPENQGDRNTETTTAT
jgi:hypothetical protein